MQEKINLVLCLAGLGSRFTSQGYVTPKYLLPLYGETCVLREIIRGLCESDTRIFLCLNELHLAWRLEVEGILSEFEQECNIIYIESTSGQAETAFLAAQALRDLIGESAAAAEPIFFHNGDTVLLDRSLRDMARLNSSGVIDTIILPSWTEG
jgi:CTP:molybdopterin cytidylyltransferase MocA